ncbi:hypothetical protein [Kitasatospora mediocidica]|uniref:hypothetical protein n=1 Tax=Kitasatospora mediocidica TaxID=58352 RepID=UPI0038B6B4B9
MTGSRSWSDADAVGSALLEAWHDALQIGYDGIVVAQGTAPGADDLADLWAIGHRGLGVERDLFPAAWGVCGLGCRPGHRRVRRGGGEYCPTAGHRRNQAMVDAGAVLCLAFPLGRSTGTRDCMRRAETAGIPVRNLGARR